MSKEMFSFEEDEIQCIWYIEKIHKNIKTFNSGDYPQIQIQALSQLCYNFLLNISYGSKKLFLSFCLKKDGKNTYMHEIALSFTS